MLLHLLFYCKLHPVIFYSPYLVRPSHRWSALVSFVKYYQWEKLTKVLAMIFLLIKQHKYQFFPFPVLLQWCLSKSSIFNSTRSRLDIFFLHIPTTNSVLRKRHPGILYSLSSPGLHSNGLLVIVESCHMTLKSVFQIFHFYYDIF